MIYINLLAVVNFRIDSPRGVENQYECVQERQHNKDHEISMVPVAYAIIDKYTMMIKSLDTPSTGHAVYRRGRP